MDPIDIIVKLGCLNGFLWTPKVNGEGKNNGYSLNNYSSNILHSVDI